MIKNRIARIPVIGDLARKVYWRMTTKAPPAEPFSTSAGYWQSRYATGGNSGAGSYGRLAEFKAKVLNDFVAKRSVSSVIEFGCGDGHQLTLSSYPKYSGVDVSLEAVRRCQERFSGDPTKQFVLLSAYAGVRAELALSLDVIYHLVEDEVFDRYMQILFDASTRYVVIYSSNTDDNSYKFGDHVRHRAFTRWIETEAPRWTLVEHLPNQYPYRVGDATTSFAEFFMFEKR